MSDDLAENFDRFAKTMGRDLPLYGRLSAGAAEDRPVRELLLEAPPQQRLPVLLFAAVHFLLLGGTDHRLTRWYPTLGDTSEADGDPYPDFRDFVLDRRTEVIELLATRNTQTNEIGRCSVLRPAWAVATADVVAPLGLIEVGASAGLNLLLDRWAYDFTPEGPRSGDPSREVLVTAQSRGNPIPELGTLVLASRVGIDVQPVQVVDDEAVRWLLACVWPDQLPRFRRLQSAVDVARTDPPVLLTGDAVEALPPIALAVPADQHLAVQNSWALNYLTPESRQQFLGVLDELGAVRDLSWVSAEGPDFAPGLPFPPRPDGITKDLGTVTVLTTWRNGCKASRRLADSHPHGTWVHWW